MRASAGAFVVQARRRTDEGPPRVGFTVSKQVGNAVERNRVRRRLREVVRLSAATAGAGGEREEAGAGLHAGHDYVLIGRRAALAVPFTEMMRELDTALGRIHRPARGRTGDAQRAPLHEAGSPSRPQQERRKQSQQSPQGASEGPSQGASEEASEGASEGASAEPPEDPPQELCKSFQ